MVVNEVMIVQLKEVEGERKKEREREVGGRRRVCMYMIQHKIYNIHKEQR